MLLRILILFISVTTCFCQNEGHTIIVISQMSDSIGSNHWQWQQQILLHMLDIAPNYGLNDLNTNMGFVFFASNVSADFAFYSTSQKAHLLNEISRTKYTGGSANLTSALYKVKSQLDDGQLVPQFADNVIGVLLMTDGKLNQIDMNLLKNVTNYTTSQNLQCIAMPSGDGSTPAVNNKILDQICAKGYPTITCDAQSPDCNQVTLNSTACALLQQYYTDSICNNITQPYLCQNKCTDLVFLVSSVNKPDSWSQIVASMSQLINEVNCPRQSLISQISKCGGLRIGIIQYDNSANITLAIGSGTSSTTINDALSKLNSTIPSSHGTSNGLNSAFQLSADQLIIYGAQQSATNAGIIIFFSDGTEIIGNETSNINYALQTYIFGTFINYDQYENDDIYYNECKLTSGIPSKMNCPIPTMNGYEDTLYCMSSRNERCQLIELIDFILSNERYN